MTAPRSPSLRMPTNELPLFLEELWRQVLERHLRCILQAKTEDEQIGACVQAQAALRDLERAKASHRRELERARPEGDNYGVELHEEDVDAVVVGEVKHEGRHLFSVRVQCRLRGTDDPQTFDVLVEAPRDLKGWHARLRRAPVPYKTELREMAFRHALERVREVVDS